MRYRFTRVWARAHVLLGGLLLTLGILGAALTLALDIGRLDSQPGLRPLLAAACLLGGLGIGGWAVVAGQLLQGVLERRRLLRRIDRRLARWEADRREEAEIQLVRERMRRGGAG